MTKGYTKIDHSIWETDLNLNERYMLLYLLDCEDKFNKKDDWFGLTDDDFINIGFGRDKEVIKRTRNSLIDKGYIEFKGGSFKNKSQYKINRVKDEDYGLEG